MGLSADVVDEDDVGAAAVEAEDGAASDVAEDEVELGAARRLEPCGCCFAFTADDDEEEEEDGFALTDTEGLGVGAAADGEVVADAGTDAEVVEFAAASALLLLNPEAEKALGDEGAVEEGCCERLRPEEVGRGDVDCLGLRGETEPDAGAAADGDFCPSISFAFGITNAGLSAGASSCVPNVDEGVDADKTMPFSLACVEVVGEK
jgi:hypothetical protein